MRTVFTFERAAVVVGPWREPAEPPEYGARIEVRLVEQGAARGTPSAAQRIVIDTPVWRADLFDQVGSPPGNLLSAHYHPCFQGVEPCPRKWDDAIRRDPLAWLTGQLADLVAICERAGRSENETKDPALASDAQELRTALPEIRAAVERVWAALRAEAGHTSVESATSVTARPA